MKQQPADRQTFWAQLTEPRHVVSILIFYCLLNFVLRLALSPNYMPGEADQVLFGQSLRWGYLPAQPPLMTWLTRFSPEYVSEVVLPSMSIDFVTRPSPS